MKTDFHSHILPDLDDGAANVSESLKMLNMLKTDGVDTVVATPHFYIHEEDVNEFLSRRARSADRLFKAMKGGDYPKVVLGAEVYFRAALVNMPLGGLCVDGTDYMMLELPYCALSRTMLNTVANFIHTSGINIILAHIERYYNYNDPEIIDELLSYDITAQANCDSYISDISQKRLCQLTKQGSVKLIGTDTHSVYGRPPLFAKAEYIIRKKLSDDAFMSLMTAADKVLNNESRNEI